MTDLKAIALKKIGPLPAVTWFAIGIGALYVFRAYKKRTGTATSTSSTVDAGVLPTRTGTTQADAGDSTTMPTSIVGSRAKFTDNTAWAIGAADGLISGGFAPGTVQNALNHLLDGYPLSATEQAIADTAIRLYGTPPDGVVDFGALAPVGSTASTQQVATDVAYPQSPVAPRPVAAVSVPSDSGELVPVAPAGRGAASVGRTVGGTIATEVGGRTIGGAARHGAVGVPVLGTVVDTTGVVTS